MVNDTRDISHYKQKLKDLHITHKQVADYIGHSREHVTLWLNGKCLPTLRTAAHISEEIDELINDSKSMK